MSEFSTDSTSKEEDKAGQESTPLFKIGDREYDADSAIKKIQNQDSFIEEQKARLAAMEEQLQELSAKANSTQALQEALDHLKKQQGSNSSQGDNTNLPDTEKIFSELEAKIENALTKKEQERLQQQEADNKERIRKETFSMVQKQLVARFGEANVDAEIKKVMPIETAKRMAEDPELASVFLDRMNIKPRSQGSPGTGDVKPGSTEDEREKVNLLKLSGRKRTEAYRDLVEQYSKPDKLQELLQKWG